MANATIAANFNQTFDFKSGSAAKVALYLDVFVDVLTQFCGVIFRKIFDADGRIHTGLFNDLRSGCAADTVDISECDFDSLILRQVNTSYTSHRLCCTSVLNNQP